jgi:hypothetical protein
MMTPLIARVVGGDWAVVKRSTHPHFMPRLVDYINLFVFVLRLGRPPQGADPVERADGCDLLRGPGQRLRRASAATVPRGSLRP